jgi:hypothetical protein
MLLHRLLAVTMTAACMLAAAAPQPGDVVFSDNFDSTPLGANQTSLMGGWSVTGGTIDVIGAPGYDPRTGHGHYLDLQGSSGHAGTLSLTLGADPAGVYVVGFDMSGNPRGNHGALRFGGVTIFDVHADDPFLHIGIGTMHEGGPFVLRFDTPALVDTFEGPFVPDTGLLLDNVTVTFEEAWAVPEPAIGGLMLMGLGVVVAAAMRRSPRLDRQEATRS